ncbi:unnamed protein product, partial [Hapterophycus canaliculatus]
MSSADRNTLVALLRATSGADWQRKDNWDTDADLSMWYGVEVDDHGRVLTLTPYVNNLEGEIPQELGALSKLRTLWLNQNQLNGE